VFRRRDRGTDVRVYDCRPARALYGEEPDRYDDMSMAPVGTNETGAAPYSSRSTFPEAWEDK